MSAIDSELAGYLRAALTCEFPNVDGAVIGEVVDAVTAPVTGAKIAGLVPAPVSVAHERARQRLWTLCSTALPTAPPKAKTV